MGSNLTAESILSSKGKGSSRDISTKDKSGRLEELTANSILSSKYDSSGFMTYAPTTQVPIEPKPQHEEAEEFYSTATAPIPVQGVMSPALSPGHMLAKTDFVREVTGKQDFNLKVNEYGEPIDEEGDPYVIKSEWNEGVVENLTSAMSSLNNATADIIKGVSNFGASIPGAMVGLTAAAGYGVGEALKQASAGEINLEEVYNQASRGMQEGFESVEPVMGHFKFPETETSMHAQEVLMSPLTSVHNVGETVASFSDSPNVRGAVLLASDTIGFLAMGAILGKGKQKMFGKKIEEISSQASKVAEAEKGLDDLPDDINTRIKQEAIKVQKQRLEEKAKEFTKKFNEDTMAMEEFLGNKEAVDKALIRPVRSTGKKKPSQKIVTESMRAAETIEPEKVAVSKKGNEYFKHGGKWYDNERKPVLGKHKIAALEKIQRDPYKELDEWLNRSKEKEEITEPIREAGIEDVPKLDGERSPFFQSDHESIMREMTYDKAGERVNTDVVLKLNYLTNKVNRWYHGQKVDIEKVRNELTKIARLSENDLREVFEPSQAKEFKETASEAARWARGMNKRGTVELDMMIPISEFKDVPVEILDWIRERYGKTKFDKKDPLVDKLRRNKDLFDQTGYVLFKDGGTLKWGKEFNTKPLKVRDVEIGGVGRSLREVLDNADKLFQEVPELRKVDVKQDLPPEISPYYDKVSKSIRLHKGPVREYREDVLHELVHAVDDVSGKVKVAEKGTSRNYLQRKIFNERLEEGIDKLKESAKDSELIKQLDELKNDIKYDIRSGKMSPTLSRIRLETLEMYAKRLGQDVKDLVNVEGIKSKAYREYMSDRGEQRARLTEFEDTLPDIKMYPWEKYDTMLRIESKTKLSPDWKATSPKLMSGIPGPDVTKGARRVTEYMKKAKGTKEFKPKEVSRILQKNLTSAIYDTSGNIKRDMINILGEEGYKIVQEHVLAKGANSLAMESLKQLEREVYSGLTKGEREILDGLILSDRMIDIRSYKGPGEFKLPRGVEIEDYIKFKHAFEYEKVNGLKDLPKEKAEAIRSKAQAYFENMKMVLKDMHEEGLITDQELSDLSKHNYRKIKSADLADIFDKKHKATVGGVKRNIYDSGIEKLAHGRETDLYEPSARIMALEVYNRAYGRILNNRANRTLLDIARKYDENPFARVKRKGQRIPSGWNKFHVYEGGVKKNVYLHPDVAKEWIKGSSDMTYRMGQTLRYLSGSPILRTFATGINWGFALANVPRDILHAWYAARIYENGKWKSLYNPNVPVAGPQMAADIGSVFFDAIKKGDKYQEYMHSGGGMEFLVHQGRVFQRGKHIDSNISKINDFFGKPGEVSETMMRLAIKERALKRIAKREGKTLKEVRRNKEHLKEATFAARDYMDFGQGGWLAKGLDQGVPYLNAGIQGTRGLIRAYKDNPQVAMWKTAQFAGIVSSLYIASHALAPKTFEALQGSPEMRNNIVIPLGDQFSFVDSEGQTRHVYLKIPLDPSQKFFKKFFEASTAKWLGYEFNESEVAKALTELSPADVTELPPSVSGVLGYVSNKDFWMNEDIWRKSQPFDWQSPKALTGAETGGSEEEYTGDTPLIYRDVGAATGASPERLKYAVEQLATRNTIWGNLVSKGYEKTFGDLPKSQKEQHLAAKLADTPAIDRFIGITNPYTKHADKVNTEEQKSEINRFVENRGLDMRMDGYLFDGTYTLNDVVEYVNSFKDTETRERLMDRYEFSRKIKDLDNRTFWLQMKSVPVDARARIYKQTVNELTEEEKDDFYEQVGQVQAIGGVFTDRFYDEYNKLH